MRLAALALAWLLGGTAAAGACTVDRRAVVPVTRDHGLPIVAVTIDGQAARMVLDTGAQRSVVTRAAVARLGLARDEWVATTMRGIGGVERTPNALPRTLSLAGVALERRTRTRDTSLTVGTLALPETIDGLLGRDYLAAFDLDLHLGAGIMLLHRVSGCTSIDRPWPGPHHAWPVDNPAEDALVVAVTLDGVHLRALVDTGAATTALTAPGLARLGLTTDRLGAGEPAPGGGLGPHSVAGWRHRFQALAIGADRWEAPLLWAAPVRITPIVDMLLGADILATRRVWISFATRAVLVATGGG